MSTINPITSTTSQTTSAANQSTLTSISTAAPSPQAEPNWLGSVLDSQTISPMADFLNNTIGVGYTQISELFSEEYSTQDMMDTISSSALSIATQDQQSGNTAEAITNYKLAIGLSPQSNNAVQAYQLLGQLYESQNNNNAAISLLKQAEKSFPQSDAIESALGNIYYSENDYADAAVEYAKAVENNPSNNTDIYSLGQAYMSQGNDSAAETAFKKVIQLNPTDSSGYSALGQLYDKMGKFGDAIIELNKALSISPQDPTSILSMGEVDADMNNTEQANSMLATLTQLNQTQSASLLQAYISKASLPEISSVSSNSSFNPSLSMGTLLATMDPSLAAPNSTATFSINITFSKAMNQTSVLNLSNWKISKAGNSNLGGSYDCGMLESTDVSIPAGPTSVSYDSNTNTATVNFQLTQNAQGNGTIDPMHIQFQFSGQDTYGNNMDSQADSFSGFSSIA